ncbi:MAG: precorrin-6y C5,15-methyltransferase (decarboxylating) subunit CbiE [Nitrospinae bacterium]|nr:precorrin-6y C5,15-methyltransferase (decarboxylating) subunit CbiE [Nitrospinota bacterium]
MQLSAKVCVIGVSAGGASCLAPALRQQVEAAEVLAGGERQLGYFPQFMGERLPIRHAMDPWVEAVAAAVEAGRRVVVLASGDPLFHGIGTRLATRLGPAHVEIHPHASSLQLAFARLAIPWEDAALVSLHARSFDNLRKALGRFAKIGVLTDGWQTPAAICRWLVEAGVDEYEVAVLENLGSPEERLIRGQPEGLLEETFAPLNVVLLLRRPDWLIPPRAEGALLGNLENAFDHRRTGEGLITKAEVRAVTLARLQPLPTDVAWDIGAGSGAVSVEWGRLLTHGLVHAIEREPDTYARLQANIRRHRAYNVIPMQGEAPQCLAELPDPDGVFIGGSGGHLASILREALSRLRPGGRLVANFILLEHVFEAQQLTKAMGLVADLVWLSVARAKALAGMTSWEPLTPVAIMSVTQGGCL